MSDWKDILWVMLAGMIVLTFIIALTPNDLTRARDAINACEAELPRDQYCEITAIPKPIEDI